MARNPSYNNKENNNNNDNNTNTNMNNQVTEEIKQQQSTIVTTNTTKDGDVFSLFHERIQQYDTSSDDIQSSKDSLNEFDEDNHQHHHLIK